MSELPIERVLRVSVSRDSTAPGVEGFFLILLTNDLTGVVDATTRTKRYSNIDEVLGDYLPASNVYKAATFAFAQTDNPLAFIKVGYMDTTADPVTEINAIKSFDPDWYGGAMINDGYDDADYLALAAWFETQNRVLALPNGDVLTKNPADATNLSYLLKIVGYDNTKSYYHPGINSTDFSHVAALAVGLGFNFDTPNSYFTLKFKELKLVTTVDLDSSEVTAVTGFVEGIGLDENAGHLANTYVKIAGRKMVVEGNMASKEFFDVVYFSHWLAATVKREVFEELALQNIVPFTDGGTEQLKGRVANAMEAGVSAGGLSVTEDLNGDLVPAYTIAAPKVATIPFAQRANRIAPTITALGRLSGGFHYAIVAVTVEV